MPRRVLVLAVFLSVLSVCAWSVPSAHAEEGIGGKTASSASKDGTHPKYQYVSISPVILPVITQEGLTQQVSLKVQLEVPWGDKDKIEPYEPRLVDAYLQDLYGAFSAGSGLMRNSFVNISAVKQRLTSDTNKVLGENSDKVHDVLLQVLQQKPM